jgi:hypothetical protein
MLIEIEKLRSEIEVASRQVMALAARESTLNQAVQQQKQGPGAAVSGANALALDPNTDTRFDDMPDIEFQQERIETIAANLKARRMFVQRTQDLIATRINTVQRMLDLFTRIEDGATTRIRPRRRVRRIRRRK